MKYEVESDPMVQALARCCVPTAADKTERTRRPRSRPSQPHPWPGFSGQWVRPLEGDAATTRSEWSNGGWFHIRLLGALAQRSDWRKSCPSATMAGYLFDRAAWSKPGQSSWPSLFSNGKFQRTGGTTTATSMTRALRARALGLWGGAGARSSHHSGVVPALANQALRPVGGPEKGSQ